QLLIKPSGSINWAPLEGKYTKPGTNNQAPGQPLYDGVTGWVQEEIDLSAYAGSNVQLRFLLKTDGSVTGDGFYFDDMRLLVLDVETALPATNENTIMLKVYPNPVTSMLMLDLGAKTEKVETLEIIDTRGQVLMSQSIESGRTNTQIETSKLAAGMYFVRIKGQVQQLVRFVKN
ncbi:MAG: T9SS type A sorting domain-containing protein, partial [Ignavibacteria bacterium]|nr:T9SS type A sorting domain-containing protein [Ignavibacteria bacterium]